MANTEAVPTLRPLTDADVPLMEEWLKRPHVAQYYEHPEDWLEEIQHRENEFAFLRHFIVRLGAAPIGFCQYYDCYAAQEDWYQVEEPQRVFSIDYLIGEASYLGKGYGKAMIQALVERIFALPCARRILVQPEKENAASCGVLKANGFWFDVERNCFVRERETPQKGHFQRS